MNLGIFSGRLGKDSELNRMSTGDSVCNFSIANDIGTRDNPKTQWIECALFGKRADVLHSYLKKGMKVTVSGRVTLDTFQGKDGTPKTTLKLNVSELDLPPKNESQGAAPAAAAGPMAGMDDDMPF